jgi:hypothetical protein
MCHGSGGGSDVHFWICGLVSQRHTSELFAQSYVGLATGCPATSIVTDAINERPDWMSEPSHESIHQVEGVRNACLDEPELAILGFAIVECLRDGDEAEGNGPDFAIVFRMIVTGTIECGVIKLPHPSGKRHLRVSFRAIFLHS